MRAKKGVLVLLGNAPPYTAVKVANSLEAGRRASMVGAEVAEHR
jgi:hypothetical protein